MYNVIWHINLLRWHGINSFTLSTRTDLFRWAAFIWLRTGKSSCDYGNESAGSAISGEFTKNKLHVIITLLRKTFNIWLQTLASTLWKSSHVFPIIYQVIFQQYKFFMCEWADTMEFTQVSDSGDPIFEFWTEVWITTTRRLLSLLTWQHIFW